MTDEDRKSEIVFSTFIGRDRTPVMMTREQFEAFRVSVLADSDLLEAIRKEHEAHALHRQWLDQNPFEEEDMSKRALSPTVMSGFREHMKTIEPDLRKAQVLVGFAGKIVKREINSR